MEEEEIQEMRDLIAQLKADNERLRQEQSRSAPGTSTAPSTPSTSQSALPAPGPPVSERLVFVPRDRKCPMFRGRSGIGLNEWLEEAEACMRARHLSPVDQAFYLYDHLEGEAREELRYRPSAERTDPACIIRVLKEVYGCTDSYVSLQEAFFSRKQQEGETLQEFSLALMGLMERVKVSAPTSMVNAAVLLRDQFVEHVLDGPLRRALKQFVREKPAATLLDVRAEAIRWEREGSSGGSRARSLSVPSLGFQYAVHGTSQISSRDQGSELRSLRDMLAQQQEQLNQLTQSIASLSQTHQQSRPPRNVPIVCRRCQQPGHYARECDGVRVPSHFRTQGPQQPSNSLPHTSAVSEN